MRLLRKKLSSGKKVWALVCLGLAVHTATAQNTYDTYKDYNGQNVTMLSPNVCTNNNSFLLSYPGEYEIFMKEHHWFTNSAFSGFAKSYSIEVVSFPFVPECAHGECGNASSNERPMIIPASNQYGWSRSYPNMANYNVGFAKFFEAQYPLNYDFQADNFTLAGAFFTATAPPGSSRVFLPHTVLKHTVYLHAGPSMNDPVVDQFSFVLDHTRGAMSTYPFKNNNGQSQASEHDITLFPGFTFADPTAYYSGQTTNALNTLDYYPLGEVLPLDLDGDGNEDLAPSPTDYVNPPDNYIHPAPYSILNVRLSSEPGSTLAGYNTSCAGGVYSNTALSTRAYHTYTVNTPVNLTTFNTHEKVIYNPSSASIDINDLNNPQVFPSGYTFKTANALYPTATQSTAAVNTTLTNDPRNSNVSTTLTNTDETSTPSVNEQLSYYYVRNNSKLVIEACVTIYDAVITVDAGGVLEYDPTKTYGSFQIVNNGGTITPITYPASAFACGQACLDDSYYDIQDINPPPGYSWSVGNLPLDMDHDGVMRVNGLIQITTGRDMTINAGVRIEFGPKGGFYIEPGASLVLNGASGNPVVLTSACQNMWKGIQVVGDISSPQYASTQGTVEMYYTQVENAHTGVLLGRRDIPALSGGIITADNCIFKNNGVSIEFLPYCNFGLYHFWNFVFWYPIPNASNITHSTFDTDNYLFDPAYSLYNEPTASQAHIKAERTYQIGITSNTFTTSSQSLFKPHLRGTGIDLTNTWQEFTNCSGCANYFVGLSEGIYVKNTLVNSMTFGCEGQQFANNIYGILLLNNRSSKINNNTFEIPLSEQVDYSVYLDQTLAAYNKPVGLYMKNSAFFSVEENNFKNYNNQIPSTNLTSDQYNYGAVINNSALSSADGTGLYYLNTFKNLCIGTQMEEDNMGIDGYDEWSQGGTGTEWKCGTYTDQVFSDWMIPGLPYYYAYVRDQGNCNGANGPAGNTFNSTSSHITGFTSPSFNYNSHSNLMPTLGNNNTSINDCGYNSSAGTCVSISCGLPCIAEDYDDNAQGIVVQSGHLADLIDGGKTADLLLTIAKGDANGTTEALLKDSPYLSDQVMIAAFDAGYLSKSQIESIALANSKLSPEVMNELLQLTLPDDIMQTIMDAQTGISPRQAEYNVMDELFWNQNVLRNKLIYEYLNTGTPNDAMQLLTDNTSYNGQLQLLAQLITLRSFDEAQNVLTNIYDNYAGTSDFLKLAEINLDLESNGKTMKDLSSTQMATLLDIASHGPDGTGAQLALEQLFHKKTDHTPYNYDPSSEKSAPRHENTTAGETNNIGFTVYPNPMSGGDATVLIDGAQKGVYEIKVFDVLGKMINSIPVPENSKLALIEGKTLPGNGMYMITLFANGQKISSQRLVVTK